MSNRFRETGGKSTYRLSNKSRLPRQIAACEGSEGGGLYRIGLWQGMASQPKPISPTNARLRRLLSHGYFPNELPPPFTTRVFARHSVSFAAKWDGAQIRKFRTAAEAYSVPRYGHARRKLSLVNPINQLHVAHLISKNWLAIRKRLKRSTITEFDPKIVLKGHGRAVTGVNFDGVARRKAEILGSYGRYVKADVARFYPSIYTHAIPWSIIGKGAAKGSHNTTAFKASFPNLLDKAVGAGQEGQTIGLPIGPDSSRILSELIAVEIEVIAKTLIPDLNDRAVRYVDDMLIGLKESETPSAVLSGISLALYDYELELNAEKTVTHGMGCPHAPEWIHYIRTFEMNPKETRQRDDLDSFFEQAFYLADANPRDNVLLFAVKRAASFGVHASNNQHLVRWMLYAARRSPSCLSFVAEHLAAIHATASLPTTEIETYILQQIPLKAEAAHTDEVSWLLFWAREISLQIPAATLKSAATLRSSVIALLTLDLRYQSLIDGTLDVSFWQSFATESGLESEMWLVAYEATKKGWWPTAVSSDFVTTHKFFGDLWVKNVEFYDPKKKARKKVSKPFITKTFGSAGFFSSGDYPL